MEPMMQSNLERNRAILTKVENDIRLLEQGLLPPDAAPAAIQIWGTTEKAVEGLLAARRADKLNFEHIIREYESDNVLPAS